MMTPNERLAQLGRVAAILLAVFAAYLPAVGGDFLWDDDAYVSQNPTLRDADGLRRIWFEFGATPQYYPLVFTSFWIEYHLWGAAPAGFHLVNILLHGLNALLLWRLLARLRLPAAWFAAALFALHPVHVESVAWITERKNTLSGFFVLAAAVCYLRWRAGWNQDRPAGANHGSYWLAILLFAAALLSKTVVLTLPAVLLLIACWQRGRIVRWDVLAVLPMAVLGVAGGLVTRWMETHHVGTRFVDFGLSFADRVLIAGRAVVFYAGKLVWPVDLTFIYPRWPVDAGAWWQWIYPAGVVAVLAGAFALRRRIGRGPAVAMLAFVVMLSPALGFVDFYPMRFSYVADHFQYLASVSLLALVAEGARRGGARLAPQAARYAGVAALAVLGLLTWSQSRIYADRLTLWEQTNRRNPHSQLVQTHLGLHRREQGRLSEAETHLRTALRLDPKFESAHLGLGIVLAQRGQFDEAIRHLETTLALDDRSAEAHRQLARIYSHRSQPDLARRHYEQALVLEPDDPLTLVALAILLTDESDYQAALALYEQASRVSPADPFVHYLRGVLLELMDRSAEAASAYQAALLVDPDHAYAHYNLGNILVRRGELPAAVRHFQAALRSKPDFGEAARTLEAALHELRQRRSQPRP
ncbi:MAG TPA: tetratricopeptide repeat protein [Planctomycetaceae bacterium]|nr:tetratricopeptide repeat protein [Planctomycetaceae bacterium]